MHAIQDVNHVHFVVLIKFEELHFIALQSNLLLRLLVDSFHVHVVVFFVLVIDLINANEDLIVIRVEQFLDDDIDDRQRNSEANGILVGVNVHVHHVCTLDLVVEVRLLAINKKFIVLLPCFCMLLQV